MISSMFNEDEYYDYLEKFLETKKNHEKFNDIFQENIEKKKVSFSTSSISIDWTYAMMHLVAQKVLLEIRVSNSNLNKLLDVGSQFSFISFAASFFEVTYLEPRFEGLNLNVQNICNLKGFSGEAQNLPFEKETFDVITSLHAIEHFGLGRYGDTLDYYGDQKGIKEFCRVLKDDGFLITGVPTAITSRIELNGQRVYSPKDFSDMVCQVSNLKKHNSFIIYPRKLILKE
ncbi:MAG: DUF268 domain-containing protein [Proteobacteria bacterium]|nr:DUF268 domain-containing protein [Pseudomonadota bacterium]